MEMSPLERMRKVCKRPAIFKSTSPEHGKKVTHTAVCMIMIDEDVKMKYKDIILKLWNSQRRFPTEIFS